MITTNSYDPPGGRCVSHVLYCLSIGRFATEYWDFLPHGDLAARPGAAAPFFRFTDTLLLPSHRLLPRPVVPHALEAAGTLEWRVQK